LYADPMTLCPPKNYNDRTISCLQSCVGPAVGTIDIVIDAAGDGFISVEQYS